MTVFILVIKFSFFDKQKFLIGETFLHLRMNYANKILLLFVIFIFSQFKQIFLLKERTFYFCDILKFISAETFIHPKIISEKKFLFFLFNSLWNRYSKHFFSSEIFLQKCVAQKENKLF